MKKRALLAILWKGIMNLRILVAGFFLTCAAIALLDSASAADLPGSKDPPYLKRFAGSEIVGYFTKSFDEYTLALGEATAAGFAKSEKLEGAITRIIYRVPVGHTELELLRNYEHALGHAGFSLIYERTPWANDPQFMAYFFSQVKIRDANGNPFYWGGNSGSSGGYVAAKATKDGQNLTLAVVVHETSAINWTTAAIKDPVVFKTGEIIVGVDIVATKAVEIKMVEVKASDIADALATTGKVDLYGIYFNVDKTDVRPESDKTLDVVASLLKIDRSLKLEIAGHTDSKGDKGHNLKLSQGRAAAVVDALVKKYGIDPARLQARGYGDSKPVAGNDTDEGRAKNRRVELKKL
jgi:OOP family OmpA-OmpF porin